MWLVKSVYSAPQSIVKSTLLWMAQNMFILKLIALVSLPMLLLLLSTIIVVNMNQVKFNYSTKNISIPSEKDYHLELIRSVEVFDSNIWWRCFHFLNPVPSKSKETFQSKTSNPARFVSPAPQKTP